MKMTKDIFDTIIIGAGIAGMTSAIYASRKRMKFKIISENIGGQFMESGEVLNYPGIIETTGIEFRNTMKKQLEFNGIDVKEDTVTRIGKKEEKFIVHTKKEKYETSTIIIATGSHPRKLGIPGEERLSKRGVTYCSICDGPIFSGMGVAIVGGGDSALEAVDFMKDIASKIYMLVRGDKFRGHEYLQERIIKNPRVEVIFNSIPTEITGEKLVEGIKYKQENKEKELSVSGVIIEIGRIPDTEPFIDLVETDGHGHINISCRGTTSLPGIFAAGDCASGHEYQYVIAAGQGCMALIKAARYLAVKRE